MMRSSPTQPICDGRWFRVEPCSVFVRVPRASGRASSGRSGTEMTRGGEGVEAFTPHHTPRRRAPTPCTNLRPLCAPLLRARALRTPLVPRCMASARARRSSTCSTPRARRTASPRRSTEACSKRLCSRWGHVPFQSAILLFNRPSSLVIHHPSLLIASFPCHLSLLIVQLPLSSIPFNRAVSLVIRHRWLHLCQ